MIDSPFRLPRYTPFGLGESVVEWATGLSKLDKLYQDRPDELSSFEFMHHTLSALNIDYSVSAGATDNIPEQGPVVIVANHPLGAIEGVILADLVGSVRKDVKVLANELLKRLPELDDLFIGVDVFNSKESKRTNAKAIRDANRHLADGGLLIVFPAGEVSSYRKGAKTLTDIEWSKSVAKFVKRHQATTVPIFINGKNSELFYQAGRVHPLLRTALLGRELLNKQATTISISIGSSIPYSEIKSFEKEMDIVNYLRLNTYLMSQQDSPNTPIHAPSFDTQVIAPIPPEVLAIEVGSLPEEMKLLEQGDFEVYCTPSQSIPNLMREIGRVREESFREVGEGSGLACDLDEYDLYYHQLFVWNKTKAELVGAYRLGMVDKLIAEHGLDKLYSRSLFNYNQEFIDTLDNSIELGRSVVSKPYQKSLNSLLLLWKGIAAFVYRHPQYTHLFGPVSISNDYSHNARLLIATTLSIHHYDEQKANLVSPSSPLNTSNNVFWQNHLLSSLASVPLLSKVLARMEQGKGLPVLLRQYLGMNGKLVCFNVDPSFNDALDGLIVVNLKKVPLKTLGKYMGRDLAQDYLEQHARR
ncbi:lysophospholipid acyltransferase family protein [Vibrio splendidus]|uniref:L-ornithine N(alpha)-acyltransferase n=1 Tax=Vibrio splendidus TaxID=29497 RepID=A0A1C3J316_VIBSP|nr:MULTISPECIES: lysophospholipid acyltransferase family protein [Vibrio]MBO7912471.1 lysophospholipid acyltransferase family protein [Vibrio sp. G41H]MCF7491964.1 lysophospholipid acyltransferase family protein [Vibrio sp. G-C-1]MCQ8869135.1 lysophospholipid acyltransferase family protein [Vibrio splendidus]MCT4350788.1 lysophospholipid acyltransferase family protein [Vibrio sp. NC2]MDH5889504.1 lysophospholipid acyltransferase family protein [Vibrio splendidus]